VPAATNKSDLLEATLREYGKLMRLIRPIENATAVEQPDQPPSIKEVVGHRAHWIGLFLGWVADGVAGHEVHIPAKGYKWSDLEAYNAQLRRDQVGLTWQQVVELLDRRHMELLALIDGMSQDQLYGAAMPGHKKWTTGRFAEAAGASHYRSAAKHIRACLRQMGGTGQPG